MRLREPNRYVTPHVTEMSDIDSLKSNHPLRASNISIFRVLTRTMELCYELAHFDQVHDLECPEVVGRLRCELGDDTLI